MNKGWLVHDYLTCIPNTRTLWYDLLEWLPGLADKCNNGNLLDLPIHLNEILKNEPEPDYIIRNASYWPHYTFSKSKVVSLLQDIRNEKDLIEMQKEVCNNSEKVIAVSNYVKEKYKNLINNEIEVLPIGVDFDFFKPVNVLEDLGILPNSILWIGDYNDYPKGFDVLKNIILNTDYNFCVVLKSNKIIDHPRVKTFNRISHDELLKVINQCKMVLCTSKEETLHLASIEAAACNLPVITSNVGIHYNVESGIWGENIKTNNYEHFIEGIEKVFNNYLTYKSRDYFIERNSINALKDKWKKIINDIIY